MQPEYHAQILKHILGSLFDKAALAEIIAANLKQDRLGNQLHPEFHFDNQIAAGLAYIESQHNLIAQSTNSAEQRAAFGRLSHAAQDFYAHSNYVALWLTAQPTPPPPINSMDQTILTHPQLRTGTFRLWRDWIYYVPGLAAITRRLYLPPYSHEAMHLDHPQRGPLFTYALTAAQQRTRLEYDHALGQIAQTRGATAVARFHAANQ